MIGSVLQVAMASPVSVIDIVAVSGCLLELLLSFFCFFAAGRETCCCCRLKLLLCFDSIESSACLVDIFLDY